MNLEEKSLRHCSERLLALRTELEKRVVGHQMLLNNVLAVLLASGHILLEGVPGLGKTLLMKTLGDALQLEFSRIQFTPDLMPADIIGTQIVAQQPDGSRYFQFQAGPVFTQLLLADEINRATPKTQSALLEAMEEKQVTLSNETHVLNEPFMVLATQNPIEMEGTYPLPEAQLDRFMVKLIAEYPSAEQLSEILDRTTGVVDFAIDKIMSSDELIEFRTLLRGIVIAEHVKDFAVQLVLATHPGSESSVPMTDQYVRFGASPRGAQSMVLMAKAYALIDGRMSVSFDDLKLAAAPCLRHRIILNFAGEADGVNIDAIVQEIIEKTAITMV